MYSIVSRIFSAQVELRVVDKYRQFSTTKQNCNSGKFRKMKQASSTFLSRAAAKKNTKFENPLFDPEYLDGLVDKLLQGRSRSRYGFLIKQSPGTLQPDISNYRDNLIEDWNHIDETVTNLGVPEMADVIGGQMFAGGHLRTTTTCCLTLRLADNITLMTDLELQHLIRSIYCWPGDTGDSEVLVRVLNQLDCECCRRCEDWQITRDNIPLSLLWARFSFRPEKSRFVCKVLESSSSTIQDFHLQDLLFYLLLVSYSSQNVLSVNIDQRTLRKIESKILSEFSNIDQIEIAMAYSALNLLLSRKGDSSSELKQKIQDTYGFRL